MKRRDIELAGSIITTTKPFSLRTLLLIFALPFIMYGLFGDVRMALVTAVGTIWLYFAVLVKEEASIGLSAARIYLPVFFLYSGLSFLGPPMVHTNQMILMCTLSGLAFALGWVIALPPGRRTVALPKASGSEPVRQIFKRQLVLTVSVITLLTYGYAYSQAGVLPAFSGNPNLTRVTFLVNGYVSTVVVVGLHIMIACGFIEMLILKGYRAKFIPGAICLLAIVLALGMSNRGVAVNPLVFALLFVLWRKNYKLRKLVPIGLFSVAALSVAGYVRNLSSWGESYNTDLQLQGFSGAGVWFAPILNYVYGTAQTFDTTMSVFPGSLPLQMGQQFFSPILMEPSVDLYLKDVFGYDFQGFGLALGSVNAFYLDWGPLGTFIGPLIIAFCLAFVYRRALSTDDPRWIILYCYLLMQLIFSVYGHPFAYLFYVIEPFVFFFLIRNHMGTRQIEPQPAFHSPQSSDRSV
ncbi:O-antigen polymerase [Pseudarthrobacter sp. DSP2-3-2b1]|uniref:O-antigen polymerase n=1 Tax=Pseudarthrobacter sp. DSP2-3-2b1 TaxID=2804661 RepID=UPI003CF384E2